MSDPQYTQYSDNEDVSNVYLWFSIAFRGDKQFIQCAGTCVTLTFDEVQRQAAIEMERLAPTADGWKHEQVEIVYVSDRVIRAIAFSWNERERRRRLAEAGGAA